MPRRRVLVVVFAVFALLLGSAPAFADEPPAGWGFTFTATLNQDAYHFGDPIKVHVELANTGTTSLSMEVDPDGDLMFDRAEWDGLLGPGNFGLELGPGESKTLDVTAPLMFPDDPRTSFTATLDAFDNYNSGWPHQKVTLTAPISSLMGQYAGTAFFDANANNTMDAGEEALPGVDVNLVGGLPRTENRQVTDVNGHFDFTVPVGPYLASYRAKDGYVLESPVYDEFMIDQSDAHAHVLVPFQRPLADRLRATMKLTKSTYEVGDIAHVMITLTNDGDTDVTGVRAGCARYGGEFEINPAKPGHGPLSYDGPGVTIPAGQTRTFDAFDTVPAGALDFGYVAVECDFGPDTDQDGRPSAHDEARVPGKHGSAKGQLLYDRNGDGNWDRRTEGVGGVKVVLRDQFSKKVIGSTRTDKLGRFTFADKVVGDHTVEVVGPWQSAARGALTLPVKSYPDSGYWPLHVKPGPNHPDPEAAPKPKPETPAPQGSTAPDDLAYTGFDPAKPMLGGLALLVAGIGLVLATRRRTVA